MTPYYTDDWLTIYGGDCLDVYLKQQLKRNAQTPLGLGA